MKYFDMGDLAAMIAPRPLVVVNGRHDEIFPIESAEEQFVVAKEIYGAAGAADKIAHVVGAQGHRFYADDSWGIFDTLTGWKQQDE